MADIMIHIGLPKTATTTIQNHLFYNLPKDKYNYIYERKVDKRVNEYVYRTHYLDQVINNDIEHNYNSNLSNTEINIFSDEVLTVPTFIKQTRNNDMGHNAKLLKEYFGANHNYKIIVTLRNQVDWLYSLYVQLYGDQHIKKDLSSQYFENKKIRTEIKKEVNYYNLVQAYAEVFGMDSVEVFLFEEFVSDKVVYFEKLSNYFNVDKNLINEALKNKHSRKKEKAKDGYKTDNYITKIYIKLINKLRQKSSFLDNSIKKIKTISIYQKLRERLLFKQIKRVIPYFTDEKKTIIKQTFLESNKKLAKEFGLDVQKMSEYGYL